MTMPSQEGEFLGLLDEPGRTPYLVISSGGRPRWALPASNGRVLRSAISVYTPGTLRGVAAWYGARGLTHVGLTGLLPGQRRSGRPPLAESLQRITGVDPIEVAVASSNDGERCVLAILDRSGRAQSFAKVALTSESPESLRHEAQVLRSVSNKLAHVVVPSVLYSGPLEGLEALVLTAVPGRPSLNPARLSERRVQAAASVFSIRGGSAGLAEAMGSIDVADAHWSKQAEVVAAIVSERVDIPAPTGLVHGDFAAWNVLDHADLVGVIDWERARFDGLPFWDLWHFPVQAASLARSTLADRAIHRALQRRGPLWSAVQRYARACDVSDEFALPVLLVYLVTTGVELIESKRAGKADAIRSLRYRARLLDDALEA
jgi:Phosphotransferase enzyme family